MDSAMHHLESVTATWRISCANAEKSTEAEQVITLVCQCGAITEYSWRCGATSPDELDEMALGLIARVSAVAGPPVVRLRSLDSSSGSRTN